MSTTVVIRLFVRRYDNSDTPEEESVCVELDSKLGYVDLKKNLDTLFTQDDGKRIIKLRNRDNFLVPFSELLNSSNPNRSFILDVCKIHHTIPLKKNNVNLLQDAYLDAIRRKICNMESRVSQAELLIPQLQWRRQAHLDEIVDSLGSRVAFLNRRFDELIPVEWTSKVPKTLPE